jgi:hypothetical protein
MWLKAQVTDHLSSKHKALSSNPSTTKKKKKRNSQALWLMPVIPVSLEVAGRKSMI